MNFLLDQVECFWHTRTRSNWLLQGDRNTHFFHLSTILRRKNNRIIVLKDDIGNGTMDPTEIERMILEYYKILFKSDNNSP